MSLIELRPIFKVMRVKLDLSPSDSAAAPKLSKDDPEQVMTGEGEGEGEGVKWKKAMV